METYSHAFFTWALAKHGVRAGRAAGIASVVGTSFPDLPAFAGATYYVGTAYLREGWNSMHSEELLDAIYFHGPFGSTGSALHSAVPVVAVLILYRAFGMDRHDRRRILLWFCWNGLGTPSSTFSPTSTTPGLFSGPFRSGNGPALSPTTAPCTTVRSFLWSAMGSCC